MENTAKTTNEAPKPEYKTMLASANDTFLGMIERQMEGHNITISEYGKVCVVNAIAAINDLLATNGLNFNSSELDMSTLTTALITVATLQLNAKASNREMYFQLRSKKLKEGDKEVWKKQLEWGIEGDGWDALIARFGRNIKKVYPFWRVRSGDKYTPPKHRGLEVTPPEWEETGVGEVIRVVYPIVFNDGTIHFYTCEKDDVLKNLYAHINNNMMNETFGICKDRYSAKADELKQIAEKKREILDKAKSLGWGALDDAELSPYISPSWSEFHARESMIIRKMRNRICKAIPKDFGSAYASDVYNRASDEVYASEAEKLETTAPTMNYLNDGTGEVTEGKPNF
jgi:hypothetical protein